MKISIFIEDLSKNSVFVGTEGKPQLFTLYFPVFSGHCNALVIGLHFGSQKTELLDKYLYFVSLLEPKVKVYLVIKKQAHFLGSAKGQSCTSL